MMQPRVDDVRRGVADAALAKPLNDTSRSGRPEPIRQDDLVRQFLKSTG